MQKLSIAFIMLIILGCVEQEPDSAQICDSHPSICFALNMNDGQCDEERTKLIHYRFATLQKPTDLNKFDELLAVKKYATCMEISAEFDAATLNSRKVQRINALYHAYDSIKRIESELTHSYQPVIIFYRWTQGDEEALALFLALEDTELLNTPALQLALATYYVKKDKTHTVEVLHNGLRLYNGEDEKVRREILPEIIKTLATTNHALGKLEYAYFWALIAKEFGVPVVSKDQLDRMYPLTFESLNSIGKLSVLVTEQINQGKFSPALLASLER